MANIIWTKGSDSKLWSNCGNFYISRRADRYFDLFQRITGQGDIRLNDKRLSQTACKALADQQQIKITPTDKVESTPAPDYSRVSKEFVEKFVKLIDENPERVFPCCSDPTCDQCGGSGIVYSQQYEPNYAQMSKGEARRVRKMYHRLGAYRLASLPRNRFANTPW